MQAKKPRVKQSLYIPEGMLAALSEEARRLDRPVSWLLQRAWKVARAEIRALTPEDDLG